MTAKNNIYSAGNISKIIKILLLTFISLTLINVSMLAQSVSIKYDTSSVQSDYAAEKLQKLLLEKGYTIQKEKGSYEISFSLDSKDLTTAINLL